MYRCDFCDAVVGPRKPCRRVIKTKTHQHPTRSKVQKKVVLDKNGRWKEEWKDDVGGLGNLIVSERPACEDCLAYYNKAEKPKLITK